MGTDLWNYWLMVMYVSIRMCLALLLTQGVKQRLIICLFMCVRGRRRARGCVYDTVTEIEGKLCLRLCGLCVCVREKLCRQKREIADKDPC